MRRKASEIIVGKVLTLAKLSRVGLELARGDAKYRGYPLQP